MEIMMIMMDIIVIIFYIYESWNMHNIYTKECQ